VPKRTYGSVATPLRRRPERQEKEKFLLLICEPTFFALFVSVVAWRLVFPPLSYSLCQGDQIGRIFD
jgi:hypothetical protein